MKKLMMLLPHCSTGGLPQYAVKKIELLKDEYEILVIDYSNSGGEVFAVQKNRIRELGVKLIVLGEDKTELLDIIEDFKPDILHLEEIPEYFLDESIGKAIYLSDNRPFIVETTHDSSFNPDDKLFFPDQFSFVSNYSLKQFEKLNIPMSLVEYPVEPKIRPDRDTVLKSLNLNPDKIHILNVGLFTPRKNQAEVFQYAKELVNYPIEFHFVGNYASNFEHYWKPLLDNKPDNCTIWGERSDVDTFYSCMDLLLFTSRGHEKDKETNPLVIKEALSWNLPILLYNLPVYLSKYDDNDKIIYLKEESFRGDIITKEVLDYNINLIKQQIRVSYKDMNKFDRLWEQSHRIDAVIGQIKSEFQEFCELIETKLQNRKNILEIGVNKGGTSYMFSHYFDNVYSLDIQEFEQWKSIKNECPNVNFIVGDSHSQETVNKIKDLGIKFDLIFIDGDHSESGVTKDLINFSQFINTDGIIAFHDVNPNCVFHQEAGCYVDYLWNKLKLDFETTQIIHRPGVWAGIGVLYNSYGKSFTKYLNQQYVVVSTHPNDEIKNYLTIECVKQLKYLGLGVILTSHIKVSDELYNLCDYVVYSEDNPVIEGFYRAYTYNENYKLELHNYETYGFGVLYNYLTGTKLAKELSINYLFYLNYDWIIKNIDYVKINEIVNKVQDNNLNGFTCQELFENTKEYTKSIQTVMNYFNVDYYLSKFSNINTIEDYKKLSNGDDFLESLYYSVLKDNLNSFYVINGIQNILPNSNINLCGSWNDILLLPVNNGEGKYFLPYISNYTRIKEFNNNINLSIEVFNKNKKICDLSLDSFRIFQIKDKDVYSVEYKITLDEKVLYHSTKKITLDSYNEILKNGNFIINSNDIYKYQNYTKTNDINLFFDKKENKLHITNLTDSRTFNIKIRTKDNYEFFDSIDNKVFDKDVNLWFIIGKPLQFHHEDLELIIDFYDENYNYLFTKETKNIENKDIKNKYFVSFTDEKMMNVAEYLVKSLNVFSDTKIILYSVNCDIPFNYPNLVKRRIDYNINDTIFLKPYVILESLKEIENGIFIDADVIVNSNINDLWNYHKEIDRFPLFTSGPWPFSILFGKPNPNLTILSKYKQTQYPTILPYVQTNLFVYNNSEGNKDIFKEWNNMCLDESNHKLIKEEYFIWDESLLNVLLKKYKCNVCLPLHLVNTYKKSDIEFINNYKSINYSKQLNEYGDYYPSNNEVSERYLKIPFNKNEIKAFHGCKNIDDLKEIYDYVLEYNNKTEIESFSNETISNDIFIISSYASSFEKVNVLDNCIKSLKKNNFDVILTSHLDEEVSDNPILNLVDYYIYDANNVSVKCDVLESSYYNSDYGVTYKTNESYGYAVLINFLNGAKKAKELGYKYAYFMNYDFIIDDSDVTKVLSIKNIIKNHKAYLFHVIMSSTDAIKTTFYYADVDFMIEQLGSIKTVQDYLNMSGNTGVLENLYWNLFNNKNVIIEYSSETELYFPNSRTNICSALDRFILFKNKHKDNELVLWLDIDNFYLDYNYNIKVYQNNKLVIDDKVNGKFDIKKYYQISYNMNDEINCHLEVYKNSNIINENIIRYTIDESTLNYINNLGHFEILKEKQIDNMSSIKKDFNITYNDVENKIFMNYIGTDEVEYKVSFKEINSNIPLYFSTMKFSQYANYWIVPTPVHYIGRFSEIKDFGGILIEFYDLQDKLIDSIIYRFNNDKYDGIYFNDINPFDCLFVNYNEFFNIGVYDDLLNDNLGVVIDIGANNGLFTDYVIHKKNAKKVYAIEPVENAYNSMYKRFKDNENIILLNKAIYDFNGKKELIVDDNCTTTSSFEMHNTNSQTTQLVETVTFHKFVNMYNINEIDLLKIDIEGAEYKVFESMTPKNLSIINTILLEFHLNENRRVLNIINKLTDNGFKYLIRTQSSDSIGSIDESIGILYAYKPKYHFKAVHLLTKPNDEREKKSIANLFKITQFGEYIQVVNEPYTQLPPSDNCLRPNDISIEPGYRKLSPGHFGCYSAHKNGFLDNIDYNSPFMLIFECDAYIISDMETFVNKCYEAYRYCVTYNIPIFSFGSFNKNNAEHLVNDVWKTPDCIEAHAYLIPREWYGKLKEIWENEKWDVADIFVSEHISKKYGTLFFSEPLSHQIKGTSLIDKVYSEKNYLGIDKI